MDNNTKDLIDKIAQQLGTTSEYLWKILLTQAPIDAIISLILIIITIGFGCVLFKVDKYLRNKGLYKPDDDFDMFTIYGVAMIISLVGFLILLIGSICSISDIVNGFFHPEYWALKKVLSSIH